MSSNFVKLTDRQRLDTFVANYRASPYGKDETGQPVQIIPSPIDEDQVRDHEKLLGMNLPPLFRAYLVGYCLGDTDLYVGQLPSILSDRPFQYIERWSIEKMNAPFYKRNDRLVPFSHGVADCSDLCFDIYRPDARGDYPIIDVCHTHMNGPPREWSDADCHRNQRFDTFANYFNYLEDWLIYKSRPHQMMFEEWLRLNGKTSPPRSFDGVG